ncbi:MAG: hypothetical protein GY822_12945 [Deltaproteobacteria bacterium]|nr:hypothetical protein [Deltaproteobacteria bacterium]
MPNCCGSNFSRVSSFQALFAATLLVSTTLASDALSAQETPPAAPIVPAEAAATEAAPEAAATDAPTKDGKAETAPADDGKEAAAKEEETSSPIELPAVETPEAPAVPVAKTAEEPHAADGLPHTHLDDAAAQGDSEEKTEAVGECRKGVPCLSGGGFAIWPRARILGGYHFVQPDPDVLFVGYNDGFFLDHLRIGVEGNWGGRLDFKIVADGASFLPDTEKNDPLRAMFGNLRDAYVQWRPSEYFNAWGGQFHVPNNIESSTSRAALPFSSRSVAADGVKAGHGYEARGLGLKRQLGLMVGAQDAPLGPVDLTYRLAVTNGNGINLYGNDNKLPALFSRVAVGYGDLVDVGFGLNYNPTTVGELPSLYIETEMGGFFDVAVRVLGFELIAQLMARSTSADTALPEADPNRFNSSLGATAWLSVDKPLGLDIFGLNPALRVSYLDPNSAFDDDQVFETSLGLRYVPSTHMPLAFVFDVTLLFELSPTGSRALDNHRATAMMIFDL